MELFFFVFSFFVGQTLGWGGYKINFEYSDLQFDETLVNLDVQLKRSDDRTVVNVRGELFEDIPNNIIVHVSQFEKTNDEYQHLVNSSINVCNVMTRFKSHPILRIVMKELLKATNFPLSCPVKKGIYFMKDFSLNDDLLPPFLPLGSFMSIIRLSRRVDDIDQPILKLTVYIDIDNAKEKKGFKMF